VKLCKHDVPVRKVEHALTFGEIADSLSFPPFTVECDKCGKRYWNIEIKEVDPEETGEGGR
jgi:hypothetical protein